MIQQSPLETAKVILLGVKYDGDPNETTGSRFAPDKIRKDLNELEDTLELHDAGNIKPIKGTPEITYKLIKNTVFDLHQKNPRAGIIVLGGEHSITPPIVEALKPENYLCFDVQWNLKPASNPMDNESVNRRVLGLGVHTEIHGAKLGSPEEKQMGSKLTQTKGPAYVSIDLGVLQSIPVSSGFSGHMSFNELWEKIATRRITACDITEYNPLLGKSPVPAELVKRIAEKMFIEF